MASRFANHMRQVYGVDFSGAADAGRRIWITRGVIDGDCLRIEDCHRGADLPGSGMERDRCLAALRDFIVKERAGAFGLDFPFGLPRRLVEEASWLEFVLSFPKRHHSPEAFREACRAATGGAELKRVTDRETGTSFSPYNLRLYRQTYFGIHDVLAPLVRERSAWALPMQSPVTDRPWLLEICPASTLKHESLYWPYKGKTREHHQGRQRILEAIVEGAHLSLSSSLGAMILEDVGGDALDSVVAAIAVSRAFRESRNLAPGMGDAYSLEGFVFV
jgi:hypothetical protein